jgi:hypothetical protein
MRRLLSLGFFAFGLYYLWFYNDRTVEVIAVGAMGLAILIEFAGKD